MTARAAESLPARGHASAAAQSGAVTPTTPVTPLRDDTPLSLARAAGANGYTVDDSAVVGDNGTVTGELTLAGTMPADSIVVPTVDLNECRPFTEQTLPHRGHAIGQAVVWLVGVTHGPRDTTSRRVLLRMDHCRLTPRVQRAPVGATLNVGTRDAMMSRIEFRDVDDSAGKKRAVISLNDAGQVVPSGDALSRAGLVEVRDVEHPWARAFVAVAPHPFVAITGPDGKFSFAHVPAGSYVLVAWHERLGARSQPVVVTAGGLLKVTVAY